MTKLHELIAVESDLQKKANEVVSKIAEAFRNPEIFSGSTKTYRPLQEDGEKLPTETYNPKTTVDDGLEYAWEAFSAWLNVSLQKEDSNTGARANLVVDGITLAEDVPAIVLLNLESKLSWYIQFMKEIPTLDPAYTWSYDENQGFYVTPERETPRTKKVPKVFVKYEATKEHPAQTELLHEDVTVGIYNRKEFSGAMPFPKKRDLIEKAEKLLLAVKSARQRANASDAFLKDWAKILHRYIWE